MGADADEESSLASAIRPLLPLHIERDDASAIVEREAINKRNDRWDNLVATDAHQLVLNFFGMIDAFDAELIIYAKHDHAAARVRERDDALCYAFRI